MIRRSVAGRLLFWLLPLFGVAIALPLWLLQWLDDAKLVGVLSERDYTRKIALQGRSSKDTRVKDIMTRDVLYVTPQTTTSQCMALMSEKKIRHLPVLDGNTVVGMISIRDILDDIIADHEETIAQLENYIRS